MEKRNLEQSSDEKWPDSLNSQPITDVKKLRLNSHNVERRSTRSTAVILRCFVIISC